MPHYYFHVRDEAGLVPDDEGSYFIDLAAARSEAMVCARNLLMQGAEKSLSYANGCVEVTNGRGVVLDTVKLRSLLD